MRKKLLLVAVMLTALWGKSFACGWDEGDWYYYNLFNQEIMSDERYRPFLLIYGSRYYTNDTLRNGNIEEWRQYLGLSYDETKYLVFKASRSDLQNLSKGKRAVDENLSFASADFMKNQKQALLYLAYAKYLEPYMRIIPGEDTDFYWDLPEYEHNAGDLDYEKVKTVLTKSWNAESDNELKLRYGYQLVRLAHYTRRYQEAVQLFEQYVEPLKMRTEMYYYALAQKAGALRGMGETQRANRDFIRVFANSYDLKTMAYTSLTMGWDNEINFADFVAGAADNNERNDIFFMMGYSDFNNPVNEIEKIVVTDPNAIQAKVLMVRAINMLERRMLLSYVPWGEGDDRSRYPYLGQDDTEGRAFFNQALRVSDMQRDKASDKNFWNLASSYLHFLNKDFELANNCLGNVKSTDADYMAMVKNLTAYIDICRQPKIDANTERYLFDNYAKMIKGEENYSLNMADNSFIGVVLSNRYGLQGEKAKSFLMLRHVKAIEDNPDESLLDDIQSFLNKKKKTQLEEYIAATSTTEMANTNNYLAYVKGVLRLTEGDFKTAKGLFEKQTRLKMSRRLFGHNIEVYYSGDEKDIMRDDYIADFSFIHDNMTEVEVADALMQLDKIGKKEKGDESAKANYLIANFFYNVSRTGYYRQYLRFDNNNGFSYWKYGPDANVYKNTLDLSSAYLEKAKKSAEDRELKAHIVYAQAKNAQQVMEDHVDTWDQQMVIPHAQLNEFDQYAGTSYHQAVLSNCVYYRDYHN
ncbi:MAG: hypothetical protein IKW82_01600 [Bacteroidales bacterium]|nr:hypothetical protein [Bacteroidales bacterium]